MLSPKEAKRLRIAGFTLYELEQFGSAVRPDNKYQQPIDLSSKTWQAAMKSRRLWVRGELLRGRGLKDIQVALDSYYINKKKSKASVWDFIRAEYRPPGKLPDYREALRRRRKRVLIARRLGGHYQRGYA